jgi:hypothetical protein
VRIVDQFAFESGAGRQKYSVPLQARATFGVQPVRQPCTKTPRSLSIFRMLVRVKMAGKLDLARKLGAGLTHRLDHATGSNSIAR